MRVDLKARPHKVSTIGFGSCTVAFLPPPLTVTLVQALYESYFLGHSVVANPNPNLTCSSPLIFVGGVFISAVSSPFVYLLL